MAFELGLQGKPWYVGLIIGLLLIGAMVYATHAFLVTPINEQIASANAELDELAKKIEAGRAAEKKLPQFREEVKRLELELEKLRRILPSSRNTEEIVKKHPKAVQAFVTGRYKGYAHALANRDEAVQTLLKYNSNLKGQEKHELEGMEAIKSVMVTEASQKNGLGSIDPAGWERVARDMTKAGFYPAPPNVKAAYTTEFKSGVTP